ncbi:hypothetical protein B0T10DRAFT_561916 [Thelonectria olida]|uniref:Uncharacterized protein n=1 Tax=Thelonectria olida TaxID=1576542 RepID=A0A9P9ASI3_9HYPO|nr:hypothetical protein B0T10DRAFT_561916 [Thelonectria olida]
MKFSTATLFVLASGIAAMPWATKDAGSKSSHDEDITSVFPVASLIYSKHNPLLYTKTSSSLRIKVSHDQTPMRSQKVDDICFLTCWSEAPNCPEGWWKLNQGSDGDPC